jgi:DNA-binding winged helix-turn-helix (wHTH) protein/TolB-like protein/Tfp pilus assembly protein PilF
MLPSDVEYYEFGPYRFDSAERLLHSGEQRIPLPPKVADTLLILIRNAGRMVEKPELMKSVWPDTFVEEGALARNISLLRKALGDTGEQATYIETIPRRGYRFVAPVRTPADAGDGDSPGSPPQATAHPGWKLAAAIALAAMLLNGGGRPRRGFSDNNPPISAALAPAAVWLAVLPLRAVGGDGTLDYLSEGMTQSLVRSLQGYGGLRVISFASEARVSSDDAAWREIREKPSVSQVLTGTVARIGGKIQIEARLVDPRTRRRSWSNRYEEPESGDFLSVEESLAEAIAGQIRVTLAIPERRRSVNPEALRAYMRGRSFWNRRTEDGLKRAVDYFLQANRADPQFAAAYSGLADSYSLLGSMGADGMAPKDAMPRAKAAAEQALRLDPNLADAHVSLAYVLLSYEWNLPAAAGEFRQALKLNPNSATGHHWLSHYFLAAGDIQQASEHMRLAEELEPLSPSIRVGIGWCLYYARRYDEAIEQFQSVTESDPALPLAHQTLAMAYQQKSMFEEALAEYRKAADLSGNSPGAIAGLASVYAATGRAADAQRELGRLEEMSRRRYVPKLYFASVYFAMGNVPKAVASGLMAWRDRCDYFIYLRVEPRAGTLRSHPDFVRALQAIRL